VTDQMDVGGSHLFRTSQTAHNFRQDTFADVLKFLALRGLTAESHTGRTSSALSEMLYEMIDRIPVWT